MKRIISMLLTVLLLVPFACPAAMASDVTRDSIVIAEASEWWGLDVTQLDGSAFAQTLIGDSLVTLDKDGNMQPNICSAITVSEDGLTITMTFPEGSYFASGEQLEPEDIVASLERIQKVSPFASQFSTISSMEVSGRDVIFHLDHYSADLYSALSSGFMSVMDKDELEAKSDDELLWDCHPYGQFAIKEYVQGSHVVLTRNPGYVTYNPYVDNKGASAVQEVTVRFITEEFTMAQEFNSGNIQLVMNISANGADQITAANAVRENVVSIPSVNYLEMNLTDPVAADAAVRQAIGLAINREELCEICNNVITPSYSYVTENVRNFNESWAKNYKENYCNDLERAKQVLEEAGWVDTDGDGIREKDGQTLTINYVLGNLLPDTTVAQALQLQLYEAGIMLNLDIQEDSYHYEMLANGDFQMGMSRFGTADPILLLQWALNYFPSFEYVGGEEAFFEAIDQIASNPNPEERTEAIYPLEELLGDSYLVIPLFTTSQIVVYADDVTPPTYMGNGSVFFNDMK